GGGGSALAGASQLSPRPLFFPTLTMNATIHPTACTTPGCTNPATGTLPYYVPGDEHDHACTTCHAAYLEALTARDDD
ncbi:hypothetical protein, partial [Nocardia cyriacigeorgica]|uniref:hypothetical protein n=1 Tax=Nocardia cyriacigeorgica TaxID=135487 RepID=UPI0024580B7E